MRSKIEIWNEVKRNTPTNLILIELLLDIREQLSIDLKRKEKRKKNAKL